jgi:ABC-type lipoprotein release transport system permease subunit
MRFELSVCLRYLAPKRGRLFVSVSTLFSILGLAVGVATYITVLAVMTGFRNQITNAYTGYFSDLVAYKEREERGHRVFDLVRENDLTVLEKAAAEVEGVKAISPFVYGKVSLRVDSLVYTFDLRGVDPEREPKVSTILSEHKLEKGDFRFKRDGNTVAVVIGKTIADKADLNVGDKLVIASTSVGSLGEQRTSLNAYVAGIFSYGNIEQDLSVYTSLETAQILQGLGGDVHRVSIKLTDSGRADEIKPRLEATVEALRKRDLLPEYHGTLERAGELLDASAAAIEKMPPSLKEKAAAAQLDEDQTKRLDQLATLLQELPAKLSAIKGPIAEADRFGRDSALDKTAPVEAAEKAAQGAENEVAAPLSLVIGLEATLDEQDPLRTELTGVEDALAQADEAIRTTHWLCHEMLFEPFVVVTWSELNPELFSLVNQERVITAFFVALIVVVAGFIIVSGLSMTVVQKKREIGILRAMGARASSVATIFGLSGLAIGLIGTLLGTCFGLLLSYNFNAIRDWLSAVLSVPRLFDPYPTVPVSVELVDLVVIWGFTIVWSVLVSVVPAITAARLRPAEALRWE